MSASDIVLSAIIDNCSSLKTKQNKKNNYVHQHHNQYNII